MNNRMLLQDSLTLANQQLERLRIITLLLTEGEARDQLPESQQNELGHWMFDLVRQAQEHLDSAKQLLSQPEEAKP